MTFPINSYCAVSSLSLSKLKDLPLLNQLLSEGGIYRKHIIISWSHPKKWSVKSTPSSVGTAWYNFVFISCTSLFKTAISLSMFATRWSISACVPCILSWLSWLLISILVKSVLFSFSSSTSTFTFTSYFLSKINYDIISLSSAEAFWQYRRKHVKRKKRSLCHIMCGSRHKSRGSWHVQQQQRFRLMKENLCSEHMSLHAL